MQNTGQYGVSEPPQFVVGRPPPAHMFAISHDTMSSLSPSAGHVGHAGHHSQQQQQQQHHHAHQQQQQATQHHHQHHHGPHPGHQPHPSLLPHQQQAHLPHPQHQAHTQHQQHQQQQPAQHQPSPHQPVQQHHQQQQAQQQQQQAQQQMVQQLGLSGPDSPEVASPAGSRPSPTNFSKQVATAANDEDGMEDEGRSTGGNRWPRQETLALIKIRSEMDSTFRDSGLKGPLWEDVSRKLAELGYNRNAKKCKEKFENVHKYYKKTKDGRAGRQDGKSYRFFSELEALYGAQHAASARAEGNAAAALLLTGSTAAPATAALAEGPSVSAQRPSEASAGVTLSESSEEDDYEEPGGGGGGDQHENTKKRKRLDATTKPVGSGESTKLEFFESLVKKLMDKQEAMQRKFLESMERRELDRQAKEEAWRRQEMARLARDHELRAQEHALAATRDAALVAFLHRVTGQTLQLPQAPAPQPLVLPPTPILEPAAAVVHQTPAPAPAPAPMSTPPPPATQLAIANADEHEKDIGSFDPNSKRWPKPEVNALIRLRSGMESRFQEAGPKGPLWEEISTGMACLGYNRNSKRCKEKWENINKYFKKTKESNKQRPENAKTCPYFHQLESLYRKGVLGTPHNKSAKADDQAHDQLADHQAVPLSNRDHDSAGHMQSGESAEVVNIQLPGGAAQTGPASRVGNNGAAAHLFSSPENGSSTADRGPSKPQLLGAR